MKKFFYYCILSTLVLFQSCDKDQKLTDKMDGEWEVQQIIFTANGQDSVATAPIGTFYFETCELGNGNCNGFYELNGYERVNIGYHVNSKPEELYINIVSEAKVRFTGSYSIHTFSSDRLIISGNGSVHQTAGEAGKGYEVEIDLKKK